MAWKSDRALKQPRLDDIAKAAERARRSWAVQRGIAAPFNNIHSEQTLTLERAMTERCFACNKPIKGKLRVAMTADGGQLPYVGPDCYTRIVKAGEAGWQPTGYGAKGPRLFLPPSSAGSSAALEEITVRALCACQ